MKKILITEKHLNEISGDSFSYIDDNVINQRGNVDITTSDDTYDIEFINPLTTDDYASMITPQNYYMYRNGSLRSYNMIGLQEDNKDLETTTFNIPDKLYNYLQQIKHNYENSDTKGVKGIKRLNFLLKNRNISIKEMYRIKNFFDNNVTNENEYNIIGGDVMKQWVNKKLDDATASIDDNKKLKKNMGQNNAYIKNHTKKR